MGGIIESILSRILVDSHDIIEGWATTKNILKSSVKEVKCVLTHGKALLQFALASVFESIRRNPDKYDNLLFNSI